MGLLLGSGIGDWLSLIEGVGLVAVIVPGIKDSGLISCDRSGCGLSWTLFFFL